MSTPWHRSWKEGRIGFHASDVNRDLVEFREVFLGSLPGRIFVPLCGKSVDMPWLAEQGHEVVGNELVVQAVEEFFAEHQLAPSAQSRGALQHYQAGKIEVFCGDFFDLDRDMMGAITGIWDRAALVALDSNTRKRYARKLIELSQPGTRMLLNVFEYDQSIMEGPPFAIADTEVRELFVDVRIELLSECDRIDDVPQFKARGHSSWIVRNYLVEFV